MFCASEGPAYYGDSRIGASFCLDFFSNPKVAGQVVTFLTGQTYFGQKSNSTWSKSGYPKVAGKSPQV